MASSYDSSLGTLALRGTEGMIVRVGATIPAGTLLAQTPPLPRELVAGVGLFDVLVHMTGVHSIYKDVPAFHAVLVRQPTTVVGGVHFACLGNESRLWRILPKAQLPAGYYYTLTTTEPTTLDKIFGFIRVVQTVGA